MANLRLTIYTELNKYNANVTSDDNKIIITDSNGTPKQEAATTEESVAGIPQRTKDVDSLTMNVGNNGEGYLKKKSTYWQKKKESNNDWTEVGTSEIIIFKFTLNAVRLEKKMYHPNELVVDILVNAKATDTEERKAFLSREDFVLLFAKKKVQLDSGNAESGFDIIFDDYYVHDIIPTIYRDKTVLRLKIYSPDKVMTLQKYCRTFVAKKLGEDIMASQYHNFTLPYDSSKAIAYNKDGMMNLLTKDRNDTKEKITENNQNIEKEYTNVTVKDEHIFPYLVQYNESFYDFLARTTNRWGEFLYYEDGNLNFGYEPKKYPKGEVTNITDYDKITYRDYSASHPNQNGAGSYLGEAPYDDNILNSIVEKDKYDAVKNTIANMTDFDKGGDVYLMKKINQLFTNNLPLSKFLVNTAIDDLVEYGQKQTAVDNNNKRINDDYLASSPGNKYIPKGSKHYDSDSNQTKYNEFSELNTTYTAGKYLTILDSEVRAAKNAIDIEFGTTYPKLKLGQIISVNGKAYIVVELTAYNPEVYQTQDLNYLIKGVDNGKVLYRVSALAVDGNQYYPMPLDSGHICKSGPQVAVVVDVDDPCRVNRVRVMYPWQLEPLIATINKEISDKQAKIEEDKKLTNDEKSKKKAELEEQKIKRYEDLAVKDFKDQSKFAIGDATPWLFYASASGPINAGVHGRHYLAEKVLIDYAHGNIERPFVVGAVSKDIPVSLKTSSAVIQAPNLEGINVHEGLGNGVATFLANMSPAGKLITGFAPISLGSDWKNSQYFEGGIDMGDRYGIWSIKGSTHDRNISISSPWGDVKISAFTGITVSAPNGDVKIQGKNVTIEAGNNLKLVSGTNIKNKFLNVAEGSLKDVVINASLTITKAVTEKLAEMLLTVIDFTFLRHVVEVFFRPLEGTLQIQSNRFLMLGAAGCVPGLPDTAYKNPEKKKYEQFEKNDTIKMGPAISHIIGKFPAFVEAVIHDYKENYKECIQAKETYISHTKKLWTFAKDYDPNGNPVKVCASYNDLMRKLWDPNTKAITISDLQFVDGQVKDSATYQEMEDVIGKHYIKGLKPSHRVQYINWRRKVWKKQLLNDANNLLKCITKLKSTSMFNYQVDLRVGYWYGFGKNNMPANYVESIKKAFSTDNCKLSAIYQTIANIDERGNNVQATVAENNQFSLTDNSLIALNNILDDANLRKALARMAAVGLLEQWGIKELNGQGGTLKSKFTSENDYSTDNTWEEKINLLTVENLSLIKKDTNFLTDTLNKALDKAQFWKNAKDCFAWGDAKKGKILFSSGTPHVLDNEIGNVNTILNSGVLNKNDMLDSEKQQLEKFATTIREEMLRLGAVEGNNVNQVVQPIVVNQQNEGQQHVEVHDQNNDDGHIINGNGVGQPVQIVNNDQNLNEVPVPNVGQNNEGQNNQPPQNNEEGQDDQNEAPGNINVNEEKIS